jgi:hypothetical protein
LVEIEYRELKRQQASFCIYLSVRKKKIQSNWILSEAVNIEMLLRSTACSYDQGIYFKQDLGWDLEDEWLVSNHGFRSLRLSHIQSCWSQGHNKDCSNVNFMPLLSPLNILIFESFTHKPYF